MSYAVGESRSRAAADRLLEVAGPHVYRRNPFRVTGLATDARAREVRQRRQTVLGAIDLGAAATVGDKRLPLPATPSAQDVRSAFDALERADQRLVDELFWWWGEPGACGCEPEVHELHDTAVEAHATVLDLEAAGKTSERGDRWADAADSWMDALDHDGFWRHVLHRVGVLSDRRLDESTVDGLRGAMPKALLAPQVALARDNSPELAALLAVWDVDESVIEDARNAAAAPRIDMITKQINEISALLDAGSAYSASKRALVEFPAAAVQLDILLPYQSFRRSAKLRNRMAVLMNNCALKLASEHAKLGTDLFNSALDLATEATDKRTIEQNLASHRTIAQYPVSQQAQIERVLQQLQNQQRYAAPPSSVPARPPLPHTWLANLSFITAFIAGLVLLLVVRWDYPTWAAAIATTVLAPFPITLIYAHTRERVPPGLFVLFGIVVSVLAYRMVGTVFEVRGDAFLWCLGTFIVTSPFTIAIGKSWAERREYR
ncbi:hypothetical protein FKR81_26435 [Lentzea tibetensis]|uniref:Uncharacterized protein n=1 Tax=Lentzea tibetensis TaxID=2591470 RepID=A0A563ENJ5_9PSEU|nr:hypothetical protein [Lentzea tibetensis]TWP48836.1 hypothetical protein FKR81_26435 [Lentzea tibetensis]